MFNLLLTTSILFNTPTAFPSEPAWKICEHMEHDLQQSVEFDIITDEQMNAILLRCLINYS